MMYCPKNPNHKEFTTTAIEYHVWKVNGEGHFLKDEGCYEIYAKPDTENIWECDICGTHAKQGD